MRAFGERRLELVPQLRRLLAEVPVAVLVARREVALLGARAFLIGPHAENDAGIALFGQQVLEPVRFERRTALDAAQGVVHALGQGVLVLADDQVQPPLAGEPVPVLDHGRDLVARVDVEQREGDVPEERLAGEPQEHRGVLAHGPQHREVVEVLVGLAKDVDALVFQLSEMVVHGC